MTARATEIWRVDHDSSSIVAMDDKGNDVEIAAYVENLDHARWISKAPQLIAIVRKLNSQIHTVLASGGREGIRVPEAFGVKGVTELLAEIDGRWPGQEGKA